MLCLVLLAGMLAGATGSLRAESTTAAATALVVLLTGSSDSESVLLARLLDTVMGIGVGLAINFLVWPPLRDRAAARRVDRIDDRLGELLTDMADRLREGGVDGDAVEWEERTRDIEHDVDLAWATVRQARESGRLNPRRGAAERIPASDDFGLLLTRPEQATAETRSMARTFGGLSSSADSSWLQPEHGALLVNLRNIADTMGDVAGAQPVRSHAPDPRMLPRRRRAVSGRHGVSPS